MLIHNRSGNVAYDVEPAQVEGIAVRHDAHVDGQRIVHDDTGRTLFTVERLAIGNDQAKAIHEQENP